MKSHIPHPFRLVVFDVDGTLVDSQAIIGAGMAQAFAGAGLAAPGIERVRRVVGLSLAEAVAALFPEPDPDPVLVARVTEGYRQAVIRMRGLPDYNEPLFPGVKEVLEILNRPEVCLGIATGKNMRGLRVTLDHHDLGERFITLQTADQGPGKPHPAMLERAMAETGMDRHETVFIGDTTFDMEMARAAGVTGIGVSWGYHEEEELTAAGALRLIHRFEDLPAALAEVKRSAA